MHSKMHINGGMWQLHYNQILYKAVEIVAYLFAKNILESS